MLLCGVPTLFGGGEPCDMKPCCDGAGEKGEGDWVATRLGGLPCGANPWFCITGDGLAFIEPTLCKCDVG